MKTAALAYVTRADGGILVAWNRKYGGWSLPGGKVEDKETLIDALHRELYEETGLEMLYADFVYSAPSAATESNTLCHVFRTYTYNEDGWGTELNSPVGWMDRETFMKHSLWPEWHAKMFQEIDNAKGTGISARGHIQLHKGNC